MLSYDLQVYSKDIARLLLMEDLWKHRAPPHALSYADLLAQEDLIGETSAAGSGIKDQRALTLHDSFKLFISR